MQERSDERRAGPIGFVGRALELVGAFAVILSIFVAPALFIQSGWRIPDPFVPFLFVCLAIPAGMLMMIFGERILKNGKRKAAHAAPSDLANAIKQ